MGPSDYALLELIERLGGVQGRKKLQKLVYISRLSGLPVEDDYFHHYYGPYSSGLAARVDDLVERGLLGESTRPLTLTEGAEYGYQLTDKGRAFLDAARQEVPAAFQADMDQGLARAQELKDKEVFRLELASTLLYWRAEGYPWEEAEAITERGKRADRTSAAFQEARAIAGEVWTSREGARE